MKINKTIEDVNLINEKPFIINNEIFKLNSAFVPNNISISKTILNEIIDYSFLFKNTEQENKSEKGIIKNFYDKDISIKLKESFYKVVIKDDLLIYDQYNYSPAEFTEIVCVVAPVDQL